MKYLTRNPAASTRRDRSPERVSHPRRHSFLDDSCMSRAMNRRWW